MKEDKRSIKKDIYIIVKCFFLFSSIIIYWELLLYYILHQTIFGFGAYNLLFILPISLVLTSLVGFNSKLNNINILLIIFVISLFYLVNLIYYKTFGSIISISMLGAGTDAITNFYWSIIITIKENIIYVLLFELPIIILILCFIYHKMIINTYKLSSHFISLISGIALWFLVVLSLSIGGTQDYTAYGVYHSRYVDTDTASKKLGVLPNALVETRYALFGSHEEQMIEIVDTHVVKPSQNISTNISKTETPRNEYNNLNYSHLSFKTKDTNLKNVCDYLNTVTPTKRNEYTGLFKDKNLIYICAESFSSLAINKDLTPTLYKMANNGIVLNNYYNAFKNVTTNGEYALITGLWPDIAREETDKGVTSGTMGQSINKDMSKALGNMFNTTGIQARGYHNYLGDYYGRNMTLPNMGFECKFMNDGMKFTTRWPSSDLEMMQQSVKDYINDDRFCTYYMTFSGHGVYNETNLIAAKNKDRVNEILKNNNLGENALSYLSCNYELELAMEYLINELDITGKLDDTVIVIAGDHFPYYLNNEGYAQIAGKNRTYSFEDYKSTCIIYNSQIEKIEVDTPCCNVDILPTILNLFDIYYDSRLYAGSDIFSDATHVAMLYNRSFITDKVKYDSNNGKTKWLIDVSEKSQEELDKYIDKMYTYVKKKYAYSSKVEETDFFRFLTENYNIEENKNKQNKHIQIGEIY